MAVNVLRAAYFTTESIYVLHILRIRRDHFPKQPSTFGLGFGVFCEIRSKYFYSIEAKLFMEGLSVKKVKDRFHGAFSTLRPFGLFYSYTQQVLAFISRGATHHTDARDLYQRRS